MAARSSVGSPRPSSARIACHMAACPRPRPPPQSPLSAPKARKRVVRPSGATPTQLMPAPQVTAMPQGGSPSPGVRPVLSTAKVSLAAAAVRDQPCRPIAAVSIVSSWGRSAPARQADVCRATGPPSAGRPTWAATAWTIPPSRRIASSRPKSSWLAPGPRSDASTVPSSATSATSVLLFPPSIASTAGSELSRLSVTPGRRSHRERDQRDRRVVVGRLDRRPRQHVVLVGRRLVVERGERPGRAGPHPGHGAEPDEVGGSARPVGDRAELDVPVPGERARQVGDLALHAVRVRRSGADDEGGSPRVRAEGEVQLLLGERLVAVGAAGLPVEL